jgi:aryl carrier-like protein
MKANPKRGKYVSRSTYQKLAEENKKLLKDIKILTQEGLPSVDKIMTLKKWREKFKQDNYIRDLIFSVLNCGAKENLSEVNPSDAKPE